MDTLCAGAVIGDIVGSYFEWRPVKNEDFAIRLSKSCVTDDSVMTLAVAEGLVRCIDDGKSDDATVKQYLVDSMVAFGRKYPRAGYGGNFVRWFSNPVPYNSWGNGSAMRVSSVAWLFDTLDDVLRYARLSAEVSHNHPEGIKGAQATAAAIFQTRKGMDKPELKEYITTTFGYDLDRTIAQIRPEYSFDVSCQGSVPESIICYLEGQSYEDVIRKAISFGGDADTMAAIAGSIAEAKYPIADFGLAADALNTMPEHLKEVLVRVQACIRRRGGADTASYT